MESEKLLVLYDGVCGLCNRVNRFILERDALNRFEFAPLQSQIAMEILKRHGMETGKLDTVLVVESRNSKEERLFSRSDAALKVLNNLGASWRLCAKIGRLIPRFLRNVIYNLVARNRYRIFGKYDTCPLPRPEWRQKFLEL